MAFSVSNNHHEVTLEALGQMERKEFAKRATRDVPTPKGPSKQNVKSSVVVYNASKDPIMYPFFTDNVKHLFKYNKHVLHFFHIFFNLGLLL